MCHCCCLVPWAAGATRAKGFDLLLSALAYLRALYSAADLLVIPSRQDNLPNTGVEAHACGTPVVAVNTGSLPDIVEHGHTGYLARAFDTEELAEGIRWVLGAGQSLRENARHRAVARFSFPLIAASYQAAYARALSPT